MLSAIARILMLSEEEVIHHPDLLINALDNEHRVLFWNKKCEEYFGITDHQAVGRILEELFPDIRNNPKMKYLETALSGKTVFVAKNKYDRKNSHYSQILLPIKDRAGKVLAAVNFVRTIEDSSEDWIEKLLSFPGEKLFALN
ncbi:MAG: PAS domain-containing protein [Flavisolibacter sp.]